MPKRIKRIRHIIYFILLVAFDQITKYAARSYLEDGNSISIIKGILKLTLHQNDGAVWGILSGKTTMLTIFTFVILLFILAVYFKVPDTKRYRPLLLIIVFIIAGAIGNLIDRIAFRYVTDFIYFEIINFPVFNFADCYITVSAIVLLLVTIFYYKDDEMSFLTLKRGNFKFKRFYKKNKKSDAGQNVNQPSDVINETKENEKL